MGSRLLQIKQLRQKLEAELKAMEEQKPKDLKIKNYLYQAIDREILDTILNDDTSKDIWDSEKKISRVHKGEKSTIASFASRI